VSKAPSRWRRIRNTWFARGKKPAAIDITPEGFLYKLRRRETAVRWDDVTQIDVGTRDLLAFDLFFAVFHIAKTKVMIDEYDDGFRGLESAVFERWPELRERWIALQCGPLHQPQYETLWPR
jgi:hypothetical protein